MPPEVKRGDGHRPSTPSEPPALDESLADGLKERVKAAMSRLERELILKALDQTHNNVTHAARLLHFRARAFSSR